MGSGGDAQAAPQLLRGQARAIVLKQQCWPLRHGVQRHWRLLLTLRRLLRCRWGTLLCLLFCWCFQLLRTLCCCRCRSRRLCCLGICVQRIRLRRLGLRRLPLLLARPLWQSLLALTRQQQVYMCIAGASLLRPLHRPGKQGCHRAEGGAMVARERG
jgi:hypothetical protein